MRCHIEVLALAGFQSDHVHGGPQHPGAYRRCCDLDAVSPTGSRPSAGGPVLEGCGTLRRWGLAGGSVLVGASLDILYLGHTSCLLTASWLPMQHDQPPYALAARQGFDHSDEKST